jgi:hypothetical protein
LSRYGATSSGAVSRGGDQDRDVCVAVTAAPRLAGSIATPHHPMRREETEPSCTSRRPSAAAPEAHSVPATQRSGAWTGASDLRAVRRLHRKIPDLPAAASIQRHYCNMLDNMLLRDRPIGRGRASAQFRVNVVSDAAVTARARQVSAAGKGRHCFGASLRPAGAA